MTKLVFFSLFSLIHSGTDSTLLMKLNANHGSKSIFVKPFSDHAVSFGIRHFAGVVMYYSKGEAHFLKIQSKIISTSLIDKITILMM